MTPGNVAKIGVAKKNGISAVAAANLAAKV
jgi:hypothetical protein